ncbi:TetR/AcrR family transcriptional regulator [Amycolatopsis albispora]|uniref:TetR family transcriptional regulator n=1 Tax=Amycolatopsis albispora TaxID=1804986 RepID=A0A344L7Y8_9PSEU|nr:TetR/AcrR family transcriptional regulator [Amycolatopsis albispora]AXB44162.1 TetR family transcriptional regulator [Amycolatopsis albispora]
MRSRRLDYSESTRSALVTSAVELFTSGGYAGTSLDEVARRARVTKGALYHHFSGKQALFEAAFDAVENEVIDRLRQARSGPEPAWDRAIACLRTFLQCCLEPAYQRVVVHEAPVVMGWERWRQAEEHFSFGLLRDCIEELVAAGELEEVPVDTTSRLLFGALSSAATVIAGSADPQQVSAEVEAVVITLLSRIRVAPEHA